MARSTLAIVLDYEVYHLTKDPRALSGLGLVQAIPVLSLILYGGHIADRMDRRVILRMTLTLLVVCSGVLTTLEAMDLGRAHLFVLYAVVFIAGIARGFAEPAVVALEAQIVPRHLLMRSSTLMATCWLTSSVLGPLLAGVLYGTISSAWLFGGVGVLYAISGLSVAGITPKEIPAAPPDESFWQSLVAGVRYVFNDQIMLGSMALDLFAVLFGGAMALLPIFADTILQTGPIGRGMLNAALPTGALLTMLLANLRPPVKHAGHNLLFSVGGFGVAMIVFALSRSIYVSVIALFFAGMFDGMSVVIRRAILRLLSPDHLRGRVAAVSMMFISSSNELGAVESGFWPHGCWERRGRCGREAWSH